MKTHRLLGFLAIAVLCTAPFAHAQKVSVEKTPKPVIEAFQKKFPGFKITAIKKEVDGGKPAYEIESMKDGVAVDALLSPEGTFLTIERQIKDAELPAKVAAAVKAKYPKGTWEKVEEVSKGEEVTYEITVKKADGETKVAIFDKAGKLIEEE